MSKKAKAAIAAQLAKARHQVLADSVAAIKERAAWAARNLGSEPPAAAPGSNFGKVTHDYDRKEDGELTLRKGDIIIILERNSDGWWRGQLGHEEGWFPEGFIEPISEDEVAQFIAQSGSQKPKKTKQEWQAEMQKLKDDLKAAQTSSQKLKDEVEKLREEYKKKAKGVRSDILEVMDQLPSAFYRIDPKTNAYHDIRRDAVIIGEIIDYAPSWTDSLHGLIEQLNSFVPQFNKECQAEAKLLKPYQDKIDPTSRNLLASLTTQHSNSIQDTETARVAFDLINLLADSMDKVVSGEVDPNKLLVASSPPASPRKSADGEEDAGDAKPEKKRKKRERGDAVVAVDADAQPAELPKERRKKKSVAAADADAQPVEIDGAEGKNDDKPEKKKHREKKDKDK